MPAIIFFVTVLLHCIAQKTLTVLAIFSAGFEPLTANPAAWCLPRNESPPFQYRSLLFIALVHLLFKVYSRSTCCICCSKYSCRSTCCIWPWFWSVANSQMFLWLCKGTVSRAFLLLLCNKFTLPGPLIHKKTIAIISNEKCQKISHTFTSTKCVLWAFWNCNKKIY